MTCADPEIFVRENPTLTTIFLIDERRDYPKSTQRVSSSARKQADDDPTLNVGLVAL